MALIKLINTPKPAEPAKKKTRNREAVLIVKTVGELRKLLGDDTLIKVGRKHLSELLARRQIQNFSSE